MSVLPSVDYQALFNSLPGSYIAFLPDDPNFTIVAESNAHASITMVKPGEVIGKPLFEVFPDTSSKYQETGISDLVESLRMVTKTGLPDTMPALRYDITSADGELTTKYWQITHYPLFDDNNELALIYQATEDITDRVATRDKLERTQQQLREALSAGIIGTWLWDIQKNIVIGDQYMAAMFGVSEKAAAAGLPLKTFVQAIHPDDRRRVQDQIAEALKSQDLYESEYRTVGKDGTVRWLIARGRTEADEQGNPVRFPGAIINITERKLIENNQKFLAKASITLASTLDYTKTLNAIARMAIPEMADWCAIELLDDNGELKQVAVAHRNPKKVQLALEYRRLQGPPDMNQPRGIPAVLRTGKTEFYPVIDDKLLKIIAKNEESLTIIRELGLRSAIIAPLKVEGKPVGAITFVLAEQHRSFSEYDVETAEELARRAGTAMTNALLYKQAQKDLAERKRLEKQLLQVNEDLERRVAERTAELGELNLNLQRSNQELQDFAYVASHDLQEPLRKIQSFGNLLEEEYGTELGEGRDYLGRMRGAAARMSALIEDILAFSRVTTQAREFESVDLKQVVAGVIEDLETRINDTKATIKVDNLPSVMADPMQMRQLFQNLIANALKFHKPDVAPHVIINAITDISQTDKTGMTTITIEDNGVGFDEKYLDRIFAVFQRLHTRDSYEGTGIGLAVCRKIVERHGGTISATSKPDKGATFILTLPASQNKGDTA